MAAATALSALAAWFRATPDAQALVPDGKLWHKVRPESSSVDSSMPYLTYFRVSETVTSRTTGYAWVDATIQVNAHHDTGEAAETLALALRGMLAKSAAQPSGAPLEAGDGPVAHVLDDDLSLDVGEGLGPGGRDCWVASFTLDIPYTR